MRSQSVIAIVRGIQDQRRLPQVKLSRISAPIASSGTSSAASAAVPRSQRAGPWPMVTQHVAGPPWLVEGRGVRRAHDSGSLRGAGTLRAAHTGCL